MFKQLSYLLAYASMAATLVVAAPSATPTTAVPEIRMLSNRADLISGGDALIEIKFPGGRSQGLRVTADDRDVTSTFRKRPSGRIIGRLTGLTLGKNVLRASLPDGSGAQLVVTNHRNGGPVFSGPQIQPWRCQATAKDKQCNQPATYAFVYKDMFGQFAPYYSDNPPGMIASTTTDQGITVPYIVRVETGYQNRDQYKIATLYQPAKPWEPWAAAAAVEPEAPHHARCQLRDRSQRRRIAGCFERRGAFTRVRGDVHGVEQRRTQLQRRDASRVARHGEGTTRRAVR